MNKDNLGATFGAAFICALVAILALIIVDRFTILTDVADRGFLVVFAVTFLVGAMFFAFVFVRDGNDDEDDYEEDDEEDERPISEREKNTMFRICLYHIDATDDSRDYTESDLVNLEDAQGFVESMAFQAVVFGDYRRFTLEAVPVEAETKEPAGEPA